MRQTLQSNYGSDWYEEYLLSILHLQQHIHSQKQTEVPPEVTRALDMILIISEKLKNP